MQFLFFSLNCTCTLLFLNMYHSWRSLTRWFMVVNNWATVTSRGEQETFSMCHARSQHGVFSGFVEHKYRGGDAWESVPCITDDPHINCSIISGTKQHHWITTLRKVWLFMTITWKRGAKITAMLETTRAAWDPLSTSCKNANRWHFSRDQLSFKTSKQSLMSSLNDLAFNENHVIRGGKSRLNNVIFIAGKITELLLRWEDWMNNLQHNPVIITQNNGRLQRWNQ